LILKKRWGIKLEYKPHGIIMGRPFFNAGLPHPPLLSLSQNKMIKKWRGGLIVYMEGFTTWTERSLNIFAVTRSHLVLIGRIGYLFIRHLLRKEAKIKREIYIVLM
jgi:hypothetical protein